METWIDLVEQDVDAQKLYDWAQDPAAGSIVAFTGTVRNKTSSKPVLRLEFEAYKPMALKELRKIVDHIGQYFPLLRVAVHHRIGSVDIGGIAVYIVVASAHREEGFISCKYIIDTLKQTVPIWKKEIFEDGEVWVAAHP